MRTPLPMPRSMVRTAADSAAVACRGAADTRESKNVAGAAGADPGGRAPRRVAWPALAVAAPAVPAIAAATRLMPTGSTNCRLRMLPPRVGKVALPPPSGIHVVRARPYQPFITDPFLPHS